MKFWLRTALAAGVIDLLGVMAPAFAGDSMTRAAENWNDVRLGTGKGVVAMRIVANARVSSVVDGLHYAWIRNIESGREIELKDHAPGYARYSYLVRDVPSGTYELVALGKNLLAKNSKTERVVPLGAVAGQIRVEEGRVTDLGTIYFVRVVNPPNSTAFQWAFDQQEGTLARIRDELPQELRAALDKGTLAWGPAADGLQRPALAERDRARTRLLLDPVLAPDGRLIAGEAFGQLTVRARDGQWFRERLPTQAHVLTTTTLPDGTLVAGASEGRVFFRAPGQGWQASPLPRGSAAPRMMSWHEKLKLVVIADVPGGVEVYRCETAGDPWVQIGALAVPYASGPVQQPFFGAKIGADSLVVVTASQSTNTIGGTPRVDYRINTYAVADGKWSTAPLWSGSTDLVMLRDGRIYGNSIGMGFKQSLLVTDDLGQHWAPQSVPQYVRYLRFHDDKTGFLIQIDSVGSLGRLFYDDQMTETVALNAQKLTHRLWSTHDGGRIWVPGAEVPKDTARLVPLADPGHLLAITVDNVVLGSGDDGKTWVQELP